jgi:putative oxidoreductase
MTTLQASSHAPSRAGSGPTLLGATELLGRILLSILFFASGIGKITGYASTVGYMTTAGVPGALLPLAIVTELLGPLALVLGWHSRLAAILLAGYSIVAAWLFHFDFADPVQAVMFLKNVSIAGGLLLLAANGAGSYSLDARKGR